MRKMAVQLAALVGFAIALHGQSAPKDIAGWDKIKWGMTMAEARAAYNVDAQPEANDDWTLLKLHPVNISGVELGVQVGARLGSEISGVMVRLMMFQSPTVKGSTGWMFKTFAA